MYFYLCCFFCTNLVVLVLPYTAHWFWSERAHGWKIPRRNVILATLSNTLLMGKAENIAVCICVLCVHDYSRVIVCKCVVIWSLLLISLHSFNTTFWWKTYQIIWWCFSPQLFILFLTSVCVVFCPDLERKKRRKRRQKQLCSDRSQKFWVITNWRGWKMSEKGEEILFTLYLLSYRLRCVFSERLPVFSHWGKFHNHLWICSLDANGCSLIILMEHIETTSLPSLPFLSFIASHSFRSLYSLDTILIILELYCNGLLLCGLFWDVSLW